MILTVGTGYHGWHAWAQAWKPECPGVPEAYRDLVQTFTYNDLASLDRAYETTICGASCHHQDCAAIILEPSLFEAPHPGFLEGVRERATRWGAVLIFDEMVLGFRLALGGGTEYFGVQPDLACYGKAVSGGFPFALRFLPRTFCPAHDHGGRISHGE